MNKIFLVLIQFLFCVNLNAQSKIDQIETDSIEVIGTTPVPGLGVSIDEIPSPVDVINSSGISETRTANVPELLESINPGVRLGDVQNNPYQPHIYYRGFLSSPLLGAPQGLSAFQDGVRINEPFGDVVNYDLIPFYAISTASLIPGSNPLYGLNTLGGSLSFRTKSGKDFQGLSSEFLTGSWGRNKYDVSFGGKSDNWDIFVSGSRFDEDGWRDFSPTDVRQAFLKVGWENENTDFDFSLTNANSDLIGNGVLPVSMINQRRSQTYTVFDQTTNLLEMATLNVSHLLNDSFMISGLTYFRGNKTTTFNGDVNDDYEDVGDDEGVNNRTSTHQYAHGASLQLSFLGEKHTIDQGITFDVTRSDFVQSEQEAEEFTTGILRFTSGLDDEEIENKLTGRTQNISYYISDQYYFSEDITLSMSGRYNRTRVKAVDLLNPGVANNLDANYTYTKFNPAIGLVYSLNENTTTFTRLSQGNRAPTPVELGCADKDNPCSLPNAMAADPFLEQIVTQSFEAGIRGKTILGITYDASFYSSTNKDDILFIAANATSSQGYFTNFGKTKRQGFDLQLSGTGFLDWTFSLSNVSATFEDTACIVSEVNSTAGTVCPDDQIQISPGKEMPGISENVVRLDLKRKINSKFSIATQITHFSEQWVHGNENNSHVGNDTIGTGKVPSYELVNLRASYKMNSEVLFFLKAENVLDEKYYNAGILAENSFDSSGNFITDEDNWVNETFYGVGAPRAIWVGLSYTP